MIDTEEQIEFDDVLKEIEVGVDISEGNYDILRYYRDEYKDLLAEVKRLQKRLASINYTVREIIDSCRRMEPHDINNCDVCTWQEELATIEDETMGVLD